MKHLLILLALTACGTDPAEDQDTEKLEKSKGDGIIHAEPAPEEKEVVVEYRKIDEDTIAIAVLDTADLPACSNANNRQLAYVKNIDAFYVCNSVSWEPGVTPADEEPEVSATPAPTVAPGAKPAAAAPVEAPATETPSSSLWIDAISGKTWLRGTAAKQAMLDANTPCTNGWRLGSRLEVKTAVLHGMTFEVGAWTAEFQAQDDGSFKRYYVANDGTERAGIPADLAANIVCIKE